MPAASSTAAYARGDAAIRQGLRSRTIFLTTPSRSTNTTSIGNRMKAVCTATHGASIMAAERSSASRPSRPRLRSARLTANSTTLATAMLVRLLMSCIESTHSWRRLINRRSENPGHKMPADSLAIRSIARIAVKHALFDQGSTDECHVSHDDQERVLGAGMSQEESSVRDQIAAVNRMPHHIVRAGDNDAAVGGNEAEAAAERHLTNDDQNEPERRDRRGCRIGDNAAIGRPQERRTYDRDSRDERRAKRPIHQLRGPANEGQHDDHELAHEQQQPRDPARLHEIPQEVDRQPREKDADNRPRQQLGRASSLAQWTSSRRWCLRCGGGMRVPTCSPMKYDAQAASSSSRVIDGSMPR